jgi:hypothetical protein
MRIVITAASAACLSVAACTTITEVTPMGKDTYMVGANDNSGIKSHTEVAQLAIKRANEFCASQHKVMSPGRVKNSGVQWWTSEETEFVFQCLDESDPAYQRPNMQGDPKAVIEVR